MSPSAQSPGRILVFARAPVAGAAKTRLIPALGAEGAAQLSARLLRRTLDTAVGLPLELWCTPSTCDPVFAQCARDFGLVLRTQHGGDLGERMANAFTATLSDAPWAVLIGSDCPELTTADLRQAQAALRDGVDGVVGPAFDAGYYLIGLRRPIAALFEGVDWGTDRVLEQTRSRLRRSGCRWHELPVRRDLDRPQDLQYFPWMVTPKENEATC